MNLNKVQIFHKVKYDLKGHERSHEALLAKFFFSSTLFIKDFYGHIKSQVYCM